MKRVSAGAMTDVALAMFGILLVWFCHQGVAEWRHFTIGFSAVAFCQAVLFTGAVWVVTTQPVTRWTFAIVLVAGLAARVVLLPHAPFLSSDMYRYIWDGRVQAAGINPYRYVASDAHLRALVDAKIFPHMNRLEYAHTIYPPGAQFLFLLITRVSESVVWMKTAMVGFECVTCWALWRLLREMGLRREWLLLYAWSPLAIWEVASSGHMDAMPIAFMALALLFRYREKPVATGLALGMAVLTKLYPIVLLPALFRRGEWKREWKMPAAMLGLIVAGYLCYASVGAQVIGFLPTYAQEEGLNSGSRYFLLGLARNVLGRPQLPVAVYVGFCAVCFAGLSWWAYRRSSEQAGFLATGMALACALMLLFSPHYPWYLLWLAPFTVVIPYAPVLFYLTACFFLYTTALAEPGPKMYLMNEWLYTALLVVFVVDWAKRKAGEPAGGAERRTMPPGRTRTAVMETAAAGDSRER